jgi:hypothetical protein
MASDEIGFVCLASNLSNGYITAGSLSYTMESVSVRTDRGDRSGSRSSFLQSLMILAIYSSNPIFVCDPSDLSFHK